LATVTIEPETKNWTWVLERECEECGFDTPAVAREAIGQLTREAAAPWPSLLADPLARVRPRDDCWSALEYGCHVRDVFRLGSIRVTRMLNEDNPQFANWDQDDAAVAERYDLQDPFVVADEILAAGAELADLYDTVEADQWQRPSLRSDGAPFTVESFGRYMLHDPLHHLADVRRGYETLKAARH
jgi:DinB superfamily